MRRLPRAQPSDQTLTPNRCRNADRIHDRPRSRSPRRELRETGPSLVYSPLPRHPLPPVYLNVDDIAPPAGMPDAHSAPSLQLFDSMGELRKNIARNAHREVGRRLVDPQCNDPPLVAMGSSFPVIPMRRPKVWHLRHPRNLPRMYHLDMLNTRRANSRRRR